MSLPRRSLRWLSGWLIGALLFMQLATAAYACPALRQALTPAPVAEAMPPCHGSPSHRLDAQQPQLCKAHCEQGAQAVNPAQAGDTPPPALLAVLDWRPVLMPAPAAATWLSGPAAGSAPPGAPPLYLELHSLRR